MSTIPAPTRAEVEALKRNWLGDPCWDIYTTDGFEEFEAELRQFQAEQQEKWHEAREADLLKKAAALGIPGNVIFARYIEMLEERIEKLEEKS